MHCIPAQIKWLAAGPRIQFVELHVNDCAGDSKRKCQEDINTPEANDAQVVSPADRPIASQKLVSVLAVPVKDKDDFGCLCEL
jgi:hypothetical protein